MNIITKFLYGSIITLGILVGGNISTNLIFTELAKKNSQKNLNKEKTAILLGYQNLSEKMRLYLGEIGPITYYFSKKGEIEIIDKAKKEDLERVLADTSYKNLVICGHGTTDSWRDARGKSIVYSELKTSLKERILQLTCGDGKGTSLVEMCAKNKEESFYPTTPRTSFNNEVYGLKLLLSNKNK